MIFLDTNALSEVTRPQPDPGLAEWFAAHSLDSLYVTAITKAELLFGLEILPHGKRRSEITRQVLELLALFEGRLFPFDTVAAEAYGHLAAERQRAGRHIDVPDAQIAAICLVHQAPLVTRNSSDFEHCGIRLINPWRTPPATPSPSRRHRAKP